jgi:hypothetical protein
MFSLLFPAYAGRSFFIRIEAFGKIDERNRDLIMRYWTKIDFAFRNALIDQRNFKQVLCVGADSTAID